MAKFVPKYKVEFSSDKKSEYCVVIPVINEGERIIHLLTRMKRLNMADITDIVIVDGGSRDGSLEFNRLKSLDVASLITKTDSGKLSAQLQCAYDYCLGRGYSGIVTIDGNDKDDPKDIPTFIKKLKEGYDFVQASRFVAGGYSENTPFSRYIAIKLIHAPMLSMASGFKWTDTTQGFRAYSAAMLYSEKLSIFRSIFREYELLAYISYAAPKFGFRCVEVGTSRIYPKGEVPTKISAIRGNLSIMWTLWKVCTGQMNP